MELESTPYRRFNGATAFRRWKGQPAPGNSRTPRCFNGATAFRRWKVVGTKKERVLPVASFNGATAFRRWKDELVHTRVLTVYSLQWGHRLSAMESAPPMIAATIQPRLQWGHRLSAMESRQTSGRAHWRGSSFNGATAFRRWKGLAGLGDTLYVNELQWGHRLSAMERETVVGGQVSWDDALQWGHRLSAMERRV